MIKTSLSGPFAVVILGVGTTFTSAQSEKEKKGLAMNRIQECIGPLKKVTVGMESGTTANTMDLTPTPIEYAFIFGLGGQGLTPFEMELSGKREGYEVILHLKREDMPVIFQHLSPPFAHLPASLNTIYLKVQVRRVIPADRREVIRALADLTNCGDQCCGGD
jgi:hypothetical protein